MNNQIAYDIDKRDFVVLHNPNAPIGDKERILRLEQAITAQASTIAALSRRIARMEAERVGE